MAFPGDIELGAGAEQEAASRLGLAVEAARAAGAVTLRYFQGDKLGTVAKDDGSPVTEADREAERTLRAAIESAYPDDAVLGEEFGEKDGAGDACRWVLDPIDGTVSFVHGVPLYGVLVGVFRGATPLAGVVHMPALGETVYAAAGGGAWWVPGPGREPREASLSSVDRLADAMVVTTGLEYFRQAGVGGLFGELADRCGRVRGWSDCYAHLLLATGRCEAVVEPVIKPWDVGPMPAILGELGGVITDWSGEHRIDGGRAIASNARVHGELLELVRPAAVGSRGA